MSGSPAKPQVLRLHRYDPQTSTSKQKQIIQLGAEKSLKNKTLEDVRKILVDNSAFDPKDLKSPFCEKDGSDVGDDMKVELYLSLLGIESAEASKIDFYFKKKKLFTKVDQATQDSIKQKLDLVFQNPPEVLKKNPELLTSSFDPGDWKAVQGNLSYAADLNEREWSVIIRSNCLLNGYRVVRGLDKKPQKVERCAYNAFKLSPRELDSYEISKTVDSDDDAEDGTVTQEQFKFRIPRFRVDDDSSVTVVETKTAFEKSCADSSFSEVSFQMEGSVGLGGVSGGLGVGGGGGSSDNNNNAEKKDLKRLTVKYNYPRVTMYWDPSCLEVTTECLDAIRTVRDPETLQAFNEKYGVIFTRRVQLGGRLTYSEASTATSTLEAKDKASKLKASASASISHSFVQASLKASHEKQSREVSQKEDKKLTRNIAWEATGGDTLLCNNPAEWCATVGLYSNWRIVNQDYAIPLYRFLASFPQVGNTIIKRFDISAKRPLSPKEEEDLSIPGDSSDDADEPDDQPDDGDDGVKKERYQIFQLYLPKSGKYLGVSEGAEDAVNYAKENMMQFGSAEPLETMGQAGASIKCIYAESDKITQFLANAVFDEGEEQKLRYRVPYKVRSWGHEPERWVCRTLPILKQPGLLPMLVHLNRTSGSYFSFRDANDTGKVGYIPDGALVYLTSFQRESAGIGNDYIAVETAKEGFLKMARWRLEGQSQYAKPLAFVYKAKEIVEI